MGEEPTVELSCSLCDQSAMFEGLDPIQLEHAMNVWHSNHLHSSDERAEYREYVKTLGIE